MIALTKFNDRRREGVCDFQISTLLGADFDVSPTETTTIAPGVMANMNAIGELGSLSRPPQMFFDD